MVVNAQHVGVRSNTIVSIPPDVGPNSGWASYDSETLMCHHSSFHRGKVSLLPWIHCHPSHRQRLDESRRSELVSVR
jgi:hypothetical protein